MLFLGTGAAEMVPNPFSNDGISKAAYASERDRRRRSALMVDSLRVIDFGPDVMACAQQYGATFEDVRDLFITHTHCDHLSLANLAILTMTQREKGYMLRVHMSREAKKYVEDYLAATAHLRGAGADIASLIDKEMLSLCAVEPYRELNVGGMRLLAVKSNHPSYGEGEYALNYLMDRGEGGKLLYVADSGLYSQENLEFLAGEKADVLIMEGTWGSLPRPREDTHLNADLFIENVEKFTQNDVISPSAQIYVTHINSKSDFLHEDYQAYMDANAPRKISIAYDGLQIDAVRSAR